MTGNKRFDWDVLLEKDPASPPVKKELPSETPPVDLSVEPLEEQTVVLPPQKRGLPGDGTVERKKETVVLSPPPQPKIVMAPKSRPRPTPVDRYASTGKGAEAGILAGNITPRGILNAFVLAELMAKPKSLRNNNHPRGLGKK